jgi:hypothetical protein
VLTKEAFYHLSHSPSLFCFGHFWDRVNLELDPAVYASLLAGITDMHHHT